MNLKIFPSHLKNCTSWPHEEKISGIIRISNLAAHIADREKAILETSVSSICIIDEPSYSPGNSLTIWRGLCGSCVLGEKKVSAEEVAQKALISLDSEIFDVDHYLADQLLIYAALAEGVTIFRTSMISNHLRTNAFIVESLTKRKVEITSNIVRVI